MITDTYPWMTFVAAAGTSNMVLSVNQQSANALLDQLTWWTRALESARTTRNQTCQRKLSTSTRPLPPGLNWVYRIHFLSGETLNPT